MTYIIKIFKPLITQIQNVYTKIIFATFQQPYHVGCEKTQKTCMVIAMAKQIRARDVFNPCQTSRIEFFVKIVNGFHFRYTV